jgi:UDP-N-acetylglucosamine--N-acetylmuramyl-(pentapeptide) pyrophosphoryl-undecaprenol N-acetylglucosamine transferase
MAEGGAAVVIEDSELDAPRLRDAVAELLGDPGRLAAMSDASRALARPDAAERVADQIVKAAVV